VTAVSFPWQDSQQASTTSTVQSPDQPAATHTSGHQKATKYATTVCAYWTDPPFMYVYMYRPRCVCVCRNHLHRVSFGFPVRTLAQFPGQ
jgi:hypothetical protein